MSLIRTAEQAKLAELCAVGNGMMLRYGELLDSAAADRLAPTLDDIASQRRPLLNRVAAAAKVRGDTPPAADQEINELRAVMDRILGYLLGEQKIKQRLLQAEEDWLILLRDARSLTWAERELQVLQALELQAESSLRQLRSIPD